MSGHRHATDRVDGMIVAECPEGHQSVELEYGTAVDDDVLADFKELAGTCSHCGAEMNMIQHETPTEVLE